MNEHEAERRPQCAWCHEALPDPAGALAMVHGGDGTLMLTCDVGCLASLMAALTERRSRARRYVDGEKK